MHAAGLTRRMPATGLGHGVCAAGLTGRMPATRLTQRVAAIGLTGGMAGPGLSRRLGCMPAPGMATTGFTGMTRFYATSAA
jgi:hypothetical protein